MRKLDLVCKTKIIYLYLSIERYNKILIIEIKNKTKVNLMGDNVANQKVLENSLIRINIEECTKCRSCADECSCFYFEDDILHLIEDFEDSCVECGHCVTLCPANIISLKAYPSEDVKPLPI